MPTTNPVPSQDPSDLLFNAGKLDEVLNGTGTSFTDRLGTARRTVAGMNADFDAQLADAESDLNVYRADAAASAAQALGYLNTIRTTSYGAYASDPATDPLGNPPNVGDEYFNTTSNLLKRFNGTTWQASDINTANLAASSGSSLIGFDGGTAQDVLDNAKAMQSYTALRAYTGRATGVRITTPGLAGYFQRDDADTTSVDDKGITIIDALGRRWKRDYVGSVCVKWFGVVGGGVISDVSAVNDAILWANSASGPVTLSFPPGIYNLRAGVAQKITKNRVSIIGDDVLIYAQSGNIFSFDTTGQMQRIAVRGFGFSYTYPNVDSSAVPLAFDNGLYIFIDKIRVENAPSVLYFNACSNIFIDGITGSTVNLPKNSIHFNSCSVVDVDNISLITDAGLQPADPAAPFTNAPVADNVFIRVTGTLNDTYRFKSGVLCNRYYRGFYATIDVGQSFINAGMHNCVFDYCYDKGIFIDNLGSTVGNITLNDVYVQAMSGVGIHFKNNGGLTNNVWINRPYIGLSGSHGIQLQSTGTVNIFNVNIDTPYIYGSNRLGLGGYDIYASRSRVNVTNGRVGINSLPFIGYSLQGQYGIYFDNCDEYTVTNVEIGGSLATTVFANNPTTNHKARLVSRNRPAIGFAPSDSLAYTTSALDTVISGDVYTNTSPYREYVSVYGSTASGAATIEVNGQQYSTRSEWSGTLEPGDTLKVTTAIACLRRKTRIP